MTFQCCEFFDFYYRHFIFGDAGSVMVLGTIPRPINRDPAWIGLRAGPSSTFTDLNDDPPLPLEPTETSSIHRHGPRRARP